MGSTIFASWRSRNQLCRLISRKRRTKMQFSNRLFNIFYNLILILILIPATWPVNRILEISRVPISPCSLSVAQIIIVYVLIYIVGQIFENQVIILGFNSGDAVFVVFFLLDTIYTKQFL